MALFTGGRSVALIPRIAAAQFVRAGLLRILGRVDNAWRERENCPQLPSSYADRFSVDSAVFDPGALRLLVGVMGDERVMLRADCPYPLGEKRIGGLIEEHGTLGRQSKDHLVIFQPGVNPTCNSRRDATSALQFSRALGLQW